MTIAILIMGRQECGTMEFSDWMKTRLLNPKLNIFDDIGGIPSTSIKFFSCNRFYQILRFLTPGELRTVPRQAWKKSSARAHQPFGGFFVNIPGRTLDLNLLLDGFIQKFNECSRNVYKCSGKLTLDEILSKCKSRRCTIKMYNSGKKDKVGILWHVLCDASTNFCVKIKLKLSKQFTKPELFKTENLCLDFLDDFRGTFVRVCQDNFFNSFSLCSKYNDLGIYVFGTCRKMVLQRHFSDHRDGLSGYVDSKHKKNHNLKGFTHHEFDHAVRGKIHCQVYNSPGRNSVIFISNSNDIFGRTTDIVEPDRRSFRGGNYSYELPSDNARPHSALVYNNEMNSVDTFDQYVHRHTIRFVSLKNRNGWILKPIFCILDFQFLNTFFVQRESSNNPESNYRKFLLKLAQGLVSDCVKAQDPPLRVGEYEGYSRNQCLECKEIDPRKDSRTSKKCIKCSSFCCKNHSFTICKNCA